MSKLTIGKINNLEYLGTILTSDDKIDTDLNNKANKSMRIYLHAEQYAFRLEGNRFRC